MAEAKVILIIHWQITAMIRIPGSTQHVKVRPTVRRILLLISCTFLILKSIQGQEPSATPNASSPPVITTQPSSASVKLGAKATFTVVASGTAPLSYKWYKWGSLISGATTAQYTTPATSDADNNASFYVVVSNAVSSVTSNTVYLTVVDPPIIYQQPQSLTITAPAVATFTVYAGGTWPITFQWYRNGVAIKGATDNTYSITETTTADNGAKFAVILTNSAGSVTSTAAALTVNPFNGTGTYPLVGEWSGTATVNGSDGTQTMNAVAGFWQTSYSIAGSIVVTDSDGIPQMGAGIASLNNLNIFTTVSAEDWYNPANLAGAFSKDLLTLTGQGLVFDGTGGAGNLVVSSDQKTLSGSATLLDGTKISWKLTRTK